MSYLNEGVKIYFRVSYGICYMLKDTILDCSNKDSIENLIKENTLNFNIVSSHQLLRISFALTLTEIKKSFMKVEVKNRQELKVFIISWIFLVL